jgi:hypothetical protein
MKICCLQYTPECMLIRDCVCSPCLLHVRTLGRRASAPTVAKSMKLARKRRCHQCFRSWRSRSVTRLSALLPLHATAAPAPPPPPPPGPVCVVRRRLHHTPLHRRTPLRHRPPRVRPGKRVCDAHSVPPWQTQALISHHQCTRGRPWILNAPAAVHREGGGVWAAKVDVAVGATRHSL